MPAILDFMRDESSSSNVNWRMRLEGRERISSMHSISVFAGTPSEAATAKKDIKGAFYVSTFPHTIQFELLIRK